MLPPHLQHWRLNRDPFSGRLDAIAYIASPGQDEALARLRFLVEGRKRLGLMIGPAGTGKSHSLSVFVQQELRRGAMAARVSLVGVSPTELVTRLLDVWQASLDPPCSSLAQWSALVARLAEFRVTRTPVTLLLDDADQAEDAVWNTLIRLLLHDESSRWPLTIVLAGRPECVRSLPTRVLELVDLRIDVEPWEADDTATFLSDAVLQAGRVEPVFTTAAAATIHELTQGVARHVVQLADLALIAGAGRALSHIDADVIESVHTELASV